MRKQAYAFLACVALAAGADAAPAPITATLDVTIDGVTQAGGTLHVGLHDEATFAEALGSPLRKEDIPNVAGNVAVQFERLPPGAYALWVYQDVNKDGRWEPGEPQGVSNGAALNSFDAAAIELMPGTNMATIHLR